MKAFLSVLIKNLLAMFLTRRVAVWALRLAAKQTDNLIDDYAIEFVDAAYENDEERVKAAIEKLLDAYNSRDAGAT